MGQGLPLGLAWRGESGLFINPDTAREMFTAQNGGPYGLGAAIADSRGSLIVMKRENVGYQSCLILLPGEGVGMVVMTNSDNGSILAEALIRRATKLQAWPRFRPLPIKASGPLVSVSRLDYHRRLAPVCRSGSPEETMSAWLRAGLVAALFVVLATPTEAAKKTYQDDALDDAAITLEADLKDQAGTVDKPLIKLKQQGDTLLKAQDFAKRGGRLHADRHRRPDRRRGVAKARRHLAHDAGQPTRTTARPASRTRPRPPTFPISERPPPRTRRRRWSRSPTRSASATNGARR